MMTQDGYPQWEQEVREVLATKDLAERSAVNNALATAGAEGWELVAVLPQGPRTLTERASSGHVVACEVEVYWLALKRQKTRWAGYTWGMDQGKGESVSVTHLPGVSGKYWPTPVSVRELNAPIPFSELMDGEPFRFVGASERCVKEGAEWQYTWKDGQAIGRAAALDQMVIPLPLESKEKDDE